MNEAKMIIEFKEPEFGYNIIPCIRLDTHNPTNGDMIRAMFRPYKVCEHKYAVHIYLTEEDFIKADYQMNFDVDWWNSPYKTNIEPQKIEAKE